MMDKAGIDSLISCFIISCFISIWPPSTEYYRYIFQYLIDLQSVISSLLTLLYTEWICCLIICSTDNCVTKEKIRCQKTVSQWHCIYVHAFFLASPKKLCLFTVCRLLGKKRKVGHESMSDSHAAWKSVFSYGKLNTWKRRLGAVSGNTFLFIL
jgi:hypothetical protein